MCDCYVMQRVVIESLSRIAGIELSVSITAQMSDQQNLVHRFEIPPMAERFPTTDPTTYLTCASDLLPPVYAQLQHFPCEISGMPRRCSLQTSDTQRYPTPNFSSDIQ